MLWSALIYLELGALRWRWWRSNKATLPCRQWAAGKACQNLKRGKCPYYHGEDGGPKKPKVNPKPKTAGAEEAEDPSTNATE
jgi:hypothetical protein